MKSGYDQFFQKARRAAAGEPVKRSPHQGMRLADFEKKLNQTASQQEAARKSSRHVAEDLRARVRIQSKKQKARKPFPFKLVAISLVGLVVTSFGVWKSEDLEKLVHGVEISLLGEAHAEEAKPAPTAPAAEKKTDAAPAKKEFSQDEINHFARLNERKRELDAREEELNRMEAELQTQREDLEKKLVELDKTRRGIATVLEERVQVDDKKVDNLVQMYSNMKPQQAAKAFEEMDEDLAVDILGRMKKKNAAEVMNLVKAEKVKALSEKYAGYKRTTP